MSKYTSERGLLWLCAWSTCGTQFYSESMKPTCPACGARGGFAWTLQTVVIR